jgi:hypothetical protein
MVAAASLALSLSRTCGAKEDMYAFFRAARRFPPRFQPAAALRSAALRGPSQPVRLLGATSVAFVLKVASKLLCSSRKYSLKFVAAYVRRKCICAVVQWNSLWRERQGSVKCMLERRMPIAVWVGGRGGENYVWVVVCVRVYTSVVLPFSSVSSSRSLSTLPGKYWECIELEWWLWPLST